MRKINYLFLIQIVFMFSLYGQKTQAYSNKLSDYYIALDLYENKLYAPSKNILENLYKNKKNFLLENNLIIPISYYKVMCYLFLGKPNSKQQVLDFVSYNPTSIYKAKAIVNAAEYYYNKKDYKNAVFWFNKMDDLSLSREEYQNYMFKLGMAQFKINDYENAKLTFLKNFDSKQFSKESKYYYSNILFKQKKYELALEQLLKIKNYKKYFTQINLQIIQIYYALNRYKDAIDLGKKILKIKNIKDKYINKVTQILSYSLFSVNEFSGALNYMKKYIGEKKNISNEDYYVLGYIYYKLDDYKNAIDNFNKIVNLKTKLGQNSYYHLGYCYLQLKDKTPAVAAFRSAAYMDYDKEIKRKSWLNYVKISCDLGNPFESLEQVSSKFLDNYPKSTNKDIIYNCLINSYLKNNNYQKAIALMDKIEKKSHKMKIAYHRVNYYYAMSLLDEKKYSEAEKQFDVSIEKSVDPLLKSKALFWKSECQYNRKMYKDAIKSIKNFASIPISMKTEENNLYHYNIAYYYMGLGDNRLANLEFLAFVKKNKNKVEFKKYLSDTYLAIADIYFSLNKYKNAMRYYDKLLEYDKEQNNYALYKKSICLGLMGDLDAKIIVLDKLIKSKDYKAEYKIKAMFELASIYIDKNQQDKAIDVLKTIIDGREDNSYISKAKLKLALIYYNIDRYDDAISTYKDIVSQYPSTFEAKQAIMNAKKIYVENGKIDEYVEWVENIEFFSESKVQIDSTTFQFANKLYMDNNIDKSIVSFENYLEKFPKGVFIIDSKFFLANCYYDKKEFDKAEKLYIDLLEKPKNKFTEKSLINLYYIYKDKDQKTQAIEVLERLEKQTEHQKNIFFAQVKLMELYSDISAPEKTIEYVKKVLESKFMDDNIRKTATIIAARSYFDNKQYDESEAEYKKLKDSKDQSIKIEALYHIALFHNKDREYYKSNQVISEIASLFPEDKKWGGKSLLLMAKNYFYLKDYYQANFIVKSILENFYDEELINQAKDISSKIKNATDENN